MRNLLETIIHSLEKDNAQDISVINLKEKSSIADYMVICSASVVKQVISIAQHLRKTLANSGYKDLIFSESGDWVMIDAHGIIIHIFRKPVREYYKLEEMWEESE